MLACLICFIIAASFMGCGKKSQKTGNEYPDSKTKDNVIAEIVQKTVDALDSKDVNNVESLYFMPAIQDKGFHGLDYSEMERFLSAYSGSRRVLYNNGSLISGSYSLNGEKYRTYSSVVALVETEDNLYSLNFYFCDAKNKKDEYIVIMSQILCYDKNAYIITKEEADQSITPGMTTKDEIINQFGSPAAVYTDVGDIIYYPTDNEGEYLQVIFYLGEKSGTVRRYDIVGELYPGWEEL